MRITVIHKLVLILMVWSSFFLPGCSKDGRNNQNPMNGNPGALKPGMSSGNQAGAGNRGISVQAVKVSVDTLTAEQTVAGSAVPVCSSQVAVQTSGIVANVLKNEGDWVNAGDVVVMLDDSQLIIAVKNAEVALDNAKINLSLGQDAAVDAGPKLVLQLKAAQAALDSATKNYESVKAQADLGGATSSQLDNAES